MKMLTFNLRMFGGGKSTTTYNYTPSPEERELLAMQLKYQNEFFPNVIKLNDSAGEVLWDSYGTVQADYSGMNKAAQEQIANSNQIIGNLQNGVLPQAYTDNMAAAVKDGVNATVGEAINSLGKRGVLNSSITNAALDDISQNVGNAMAQSYNDNVATLSQLGQQGVSNAAAGITTSAAAQEAAQQPALNLWNASLGLQQSGNNVLGNIAGKYGTGVQTSKNSGSGIGGFLGGVATGLAGNSGFWNYMK